jgi:hypothetical protein
MQVSEIDGRRVIVVLLGSTWASWYADAERLLDYGFETLATPGRAPGNGMIDFSAPAPAHVVMNAPQRSATGLTVSLLPDGTQIVTSSELSSARGWSPWFWLGAVTVMVPSMSFFAIQLQKFLALMSSGSARRRVTYPSRSASTVSAPTRFGMETQPFPLVTGGRTSMPVAHEAWSVSQRLEQQRSSPGRVRDIAPSFAGD